MISNCPYSYDAMQLWIMGCLVSVRQWKLIYSPGITQWRIGTKHRTLQLEALSHLYRVCLRIWSMWTWQFNQDFFVPCQKWRRHASQLQILSFGIEENQMRKSLPMWAWRIQSLANDLLSIGTIAVVQRLVFLLSQWICKEFTRGEITVMLSRVVQWGCAVLWPEGRDI